MIHSFGFSLWPSWAGRRAGPVSPLRANEVQAGAARVQSHRRADLGEGQCGSVLRIIERVCAAHQEHLGFAAFLVWGDFQRRC